MKRWPIAALALLMIADVATAATQHEPPGAGRHRTYSAVAASGAAPAIAVQPPVSPPAPSEGTQPANAAGSGTPIYVWKEKGIVHAVSSPGDVPARFSRRVEGPSEDPQIIRMRPELPPPGAVHAVKKAKGKKPHRPASRSAVSKKTGHPAAVAKPEEQSAVKTAPPVPLRR